jgi:hypothetical protein
MGWDIIGDIRDAETIAAGRRLKARRRLATVRLPDGTIREAEVHWYEATGFGKQELKIKRLLNDT